MRSYRTMSSYHRHLRVQHPLKAKLPPQRKEDVGKLTVILDIDETLIHSDMNNRVKHSMTKAEYFNIDIDSTQVKVYRRPHLEWFLQEASSKFELVTFTAGMEFYAKMILSELDPDQSMIRHRFYRDHCTPIQGGTYTKDLEHLNRPLNRVVLVDNNPVCFLTHPDNGVPIQSFYGEKNDTSLKAVMTYLDKLSEVEDVRPVLQQSFGLRGSLPNIYVPNSSGAML
jgi:CTD small phosphatase-like protein 2